MAEPRGQGGVPAGERELTVIRFPPTMLSNAEIAAELAVRRGRELHLLRASLRTR